MPAGGRSCVHTERTGAMTHRALVAFAAAFVVIGGGPAVAGGDEAQTLKIMRSLEVVEPFAHAGKNFDEASTDISGLACEAGRNGRCLAIDDEGRAAQFFATDGDKIKPAKDTVTLIDEGMRAKILGREPKLNCPKEEILFEDVDGEGVAYFAPHFYVVGSHGCSRKKGKAAVSAFVTARVRPDGSGLETTYRLGDALRLVDARAFATKVGNKDNPAANGMNVEGVAVAGGVLYAGLRAPVSRDSLIVGVPIVELFNPGHDVYAGSPAVSRLKLPEDSGIRDLAVLPGGRMLILAGPTREENVPYGLYAAKLNNLADVTPLGELEPPTREAKAEGILPIGVDGTRLTVLVVFDGVANGAPSIYEAALPE